MCNFFNLITKKYINVFLIFANLINGILSAEITSKLTTTSQNCSDDVVVACAYPQKADQLRFISSKEDLSALCPDLHKGLRCIDNYTRNCMEPHQRSHFNHLYSGTSMVIHEICTEGPLQEEFLRHAPCMNKVRDDYELCANQYQDRINYIKQDLGLADKDDNVEKICCFLQEYLKCSKDMVKKTCGEQTAKFASGVLDKMSNSLMVEHCEKLSLFEENCKSQGVHFKNQNSIFEKIFILLLPLFIHYKLKK